MNSNALLSTSLYYRGKREHAQNLGWYTHILDNLSVTIQPRGAAGMTAQSSSQSTAQFAQTFVTGTLKRAIGTVTDTVTSFMTGNNSPTAVVYSPAGSSDDVVNVQVNVSRLSLVSKSGLVSSIIYLE